MSVPETSRPEPESRGLAACVPRPEDHQAVSGTVIRFAASEERRKALRGAAHA